MPSCKAGHVYIVYTTLTKPPKEKYALCVPPDDEWFVWVNTLPRPHGKDQLKLQAGCHELIVHDSYLDLSRVVYHSAAELEEGREFACISQALAQTIATFMDAGIEVMPQRQIDAVHSTVDALRLI